MFQVQRFTADDDEENEAGHEPNLSQHNKNLTMLLERAKSRVKRTRLLTQPSRHSDGSSDKSLRKRKKSAPDGTRELKTERIAAATFGSVGVDSAATSVVQVDVAETKATSKTVQVGAREAEGSNEEEQEEEGEDSSSADEEDSEEESEREEQGEVGDVIIGESLGGATAAGGFEVEGEQQENRQGPRPMEEVAQEWGLDPRLTETLREESVKHFFPIQVQ